MRRCARRHIGSKTHFGSRTVETAEKQGMVNAVFHNVADKYDWMNDVMSAGIHRLWKHKLVHDVLQPRPGAQVLDVAGGTGDIAFRIVDAIHTRENPKQRMSRVTVCDINASMLQVGKARAKESGYLDKENCSMDFTEGDAQELPFDDETFDAYTIAFGMRNVPDIDKALREAHRVLKPGGRFLCLEFAPIKSPQLLAAAYDAYSFHVIPRMGELVANDRESYQYLVESIRKFPDQHEYKDRIISNGFPQEYVYYENLSLGVCSIHSAYK